MSLTASAVAFSEDPLKQASPSPTAVLNPPRSSFLPPVPSLDNILNLITVSLIGCLLLLSLLSLCLILLLRLRCRRHRRLRGFASHSAPRLLLITLVCLWAAAELLRIPLFRTNLLVSSQARICKLHVILSLGFFEPGFLVSLLFLVNSSLQSGHVAGGLIKGLVFVLTFCCPIFLALYVTTYRLNTRAPPLPGVFFQSATFFLENNQDENVDTKVVLCIYPLLSAAVFGAFGVLYAVALLCKCWKVISKAINKRLASRVNLLSFTLLMCLALQVVLMSLSVFFTPTHATYYLVVFLAFVSVLVCAALGEFILVIIPIIDALSTDYSGRTSPSPTRAN